MYTTVQALDNTFTLISSVHLFRYVPFILQNATFDMVGDSCDAPCTYVPPSLMTLSRLLKQFSPGLGFLIYFDVCAVMFICPCRYL